MTSDTNPDRPSRSSRKPASPSDVVSDFDDIRALAASLHDLYRQLADACAPIVQDIIRTHCRDRNHIERTLDSLLDCACIPEGLALFKSLCRYYFTLDPSATADYINFYREMWDSDDDQEVEAGL